MATFDYFVGSVKCTVCGHTCSDRSSNMQTKLKVRPSLSDLRVGDCLDLNWSDLCSAGYIEISVPVRADTLTILEPWECPDCGKSYNWAMVEITDGRIQSIHEIALSAESLQKANYISEECRYLLDTPTAYDLTIDALIAQLQA